MKKKNTKRSKNPQEPFSVQVLGRKTAIGIGFFILSGIATSLFSGVFNAWAIAIKNASKGFFRKFADTFVIRAADTELTDEAAGLALAIFILMGYGLWMFVKFLESELNQVDQEIASLKKVKNEKTGNDNLRPLIQKLEAEQTKRVSELTARSAKDRKALRWIKWICRVSLVLLCYSLLLQEVAYALVKTYRRDVVRIRPFVSDLEVQRLNRQWVMMRSFRDYWAIKDKLSEYEKRSDFTEVEKSATVE